MLDLLLMLTLGFLGSFGHCVGMCGPLTVAFALSQRQSSLPEWRRYLYFHGLLNLGRIVSYAVVGAGIGALGSILIAGGQLAGVDSVLRRGISIVTGLLLIWFGLSQIQPSQIYPLPFLHPLLQGRLHDRLSRFMTHLSFSSQWGTPFVLGLVWGLIPCGFLYAAQIKAVETGSFSLGAMTMLAFGLGTMPMMIGVGVSTAFLSHDRRSQLFQLGGWITLMIGILMVFRSSEMVDLTGHAALFCLMLALIARPISGVWPGLLKYRRVLGVGAFVLSLAHIFHMLDHTFNWNLAALVFMMPYYQVGMWLGIVAIALITPAALTSFDWMVKTLGSRWRQIHLLAVPALLCASLHTILVGSHYLGSLQWTLTQKMSSLSLGLLTLGVLMSRKHQVWALFSLGNFYASPPPSSSSK